MSARYAIYFAPPEASLLWCTASRWLGRDAARDRRLDQPGVPGYSGERIGELTRAARLYGFHATLKPPMRLNKGRSAGQLADALARFAAARTAFSLPPLEVACLSTFLALRPVAASALLHRLADDCVVEFDGFRRPLDANELARRRSSGLTARQDALLVSLGYPYVLDQFRFHMTLTDALDPQDSARIKPWLEQRFAAALQEPIVVTDLSLFVQEDPGAPFRILERFPLNLP
jgi:putative phosphonate metabolism protein